MLAKILEDMWVEPEVLGALSDEQKRILFLKMREEQVRRWREREEREEREGREYLSVGSKKASSKHVSWLLGRDGDVSVSIIGEVDEFRSCKVLRSVTNNRLGSDNMNGIQTADSLPGREAQQLGFKGDIQLPLADVSDDPASPSEPSSEEDSCSADDELKDAAEDSDSGGCSDNLGDWAPLGRAHSCRHGNQPLKAQPSDAGRDGTHDRETRYCERKTQSGSRVAQLRKAFADNPHHASPPYTKPAIPAKPAHLQRGSMPLVR